MFTQILRGPRNNYRRARRTPLPWISLIISTVAICFLIGRSELTAEYGQVFNYAVASVNHHFSLKSDLAKSKLTPALKKQFVPNMMYKVLIFAAAIAAIAAQVQLPESSPCTPDSIFKYECNSCRCNKAGTGAVCTKMACPPTAALESESTSHPANTPCTPGSTFKYYCNNCFCAKDGSGAACTRMSCPKGLFNRDGTMNVLRDQEPPREKREVESEQYPELPADGSCTVGRMYKSDCNTCRCIKENLPACTMKACIKAPIQRRSVNVKEPWGPFYEQGTPCEPNSMFYSQCNLCKCLEDGLHAKCTYKACVTGY